MNKYDEKYDIRLAKYDEIDDIMEFIKENWNKEHILANDRRYFEYEYVDGKEVHFLLARNREDNQIVGIIGYIPASKEIQNLDVWTVMWKVKERTIPLLGMELQKRVKTILEARSLLGVGDNPNTTIRLFNRLTDYETAKMRHFYMLSKKKEFMIADIKCPVFSEDYKRDLNIEIIEINTIEQLYNLYDFEKNKGQIPYKDKEYINHRYFEHPVYSYKVYGVKNKENVEAILILREQVYKQSKVLRVVDYIGEQSCFAGLSSFFERKLDEYEYIDFYEHGFDEKYMLKAGFIERTDEDSNIIPNYFNPYERRNIDIWCSGSEKGGLYCKGDADQDRPNWLR